MPDFLVRILQSRKFWLAFISAVAATVLYVQGQIPAEQLANLYAALGVALCAAIALEDAALKLNATAWGRDDRGGATDR